MADLLCHGLKTMIKISLTVTIVFMEMIFGGCLQTVSCVRTNTF